MVVYHGSNHNFKTLRISKSLASHDESTLVEGYGIYFSTFRDVAESYGKYVYVLNLNPAYIIDFREFKGCVKYLSSLREDVNKCYKVDIFKFLSLPPLVYGMVNGQFAVTRISNEVYLLLDSDPRWHELIGNSYESIMSYIRGYDQQHQVIVLYNDPSIRGAGVVKRILPEAVKIYAKERGGVLY